MSEKQSDMERITGAVALSRGRVRMYDAVVVFLSCTLRTAASVAPLATVVDMSRDVAKVERGAKAAAALWRTGV
jgi:hypothetical protein